MKVGIENKLTSSTVTLTSTDLGVSGKPVSNILLAPMIKEFEGSDASITIDLEFTATSIDAIFLFNVDVETSIRIRTYDTGLAGSVTNDQTFTSSNYAGLQYDNIKFELSAPGSMAAIKIVITGTAGYETKIGQIWGCKLQDFGKLESIQPADVSSDITTISRANVPDINRVYNFRTYNATTKKLAFDTTRTNFRIIIEDGLTEPRPYIFDECLFDNEFCLGIVDGEQIGYDIFETEDTASALSQSSIIIREVF